MRIHRIETQLRRDLFGTMECEGCGHIQKFVGYDDHYYHVKAVPKIKCKACGKSAEDLGVDTKPMTPRYPPHVVV